MMETNHRRSIRECVEEAVGQAPRHLNSIYAFVLRFRPGTAEETVRARVYEALEAGTIRRLAKGIYFARSGAGTLLLVEGDAREVLRTWDSDSIDAIITDPPYDLGTKKHAMTGTTRPHQGKGRTYEQWDLDRATLADMFRVLRKDKEWNTLSRAKRSAGEFPRGGGAMLLFAPPITRSTWPHIRALIDMAESLGFVFYGTITWDHEIMGMGYDTGRNQKNEVLFFTAGARNGLLWDSGFRNVLRAKRSGRRSGEHEAEKPVAVFVRLVQAVTRAGDVVADFFAGRGRWIPSALASERHVVAVDCDGRWVARISSDQPQRQFG